MSHLLWLTDGLRARDRRFGELRDELADMTAARDAAVAVANELRQERDSLRDRLAIVGTFLAEASSLLEPRK
jgi:uncharacterized coiled-coil DUF342 family protein